MTTAAQLRAAIFSAAENALTTEPADLDARARSFIARLSGSMQHLQERELDRAVWSILAAPAEVAEGLAAVANPELAEWAGRKLFKTDSTSAGRACPSPEPDPEASSAKSAQDQEPR